jgi:hypothetical protein
LHPADRSLLPNPSGSAALAIDLALRLTLLDLLLRPVGNWALRPVIVGLAAVALLQSRWLRMPQLWFAIATLAAFRVWLDWPLADNHAYLLAYWCLAAALACRAADPAPILAFNGRLLIALVFVFSCIWKFAGSDNYLDGTFFKVTLLVDPRFEGFVQVVAGLDLNTIDRWREFLEAHRDSPLALDDSGIALPARFTALAYAATGWNLFINAALAIAFLWPRCRMSDNISHVLLLTYCAITYAVATVDGFAWLLLAMGASMCTFEQRRTRIAYVAVFVLIIFYREIPWADNILLPLLHR